MRQSAAGTDLKKEAEECSLFEAVTKQLLAKPNRPSYSR
jgi:hypothetical protein